MGIITARHVENGLVKMKSLNSDTQTNDMDYIKLESHGDKTNVEISGTAGNLVEMLTSAILNDMNFSILILTAMSRIANQEKNQIDKINLN